MFRKSCFTLVEMLIVLAIVLAAASVIGISTTNAIKNERMRAGTALVIDKLQLAQDLMLILKTDVRVKFSEDQRTHELICLLEVEKSLENSFANLINSNPRITGIQFVSFDNQETNIKQNLPFQIHFESGGTKMSRGTLNLCADAKQQREEKIFLAGYPMPIGKGKWNSSSHNNDNKQEGLYPKEIRKILEEASPLPST